MIQDYSMLLCMCLITTFPACIAYLQTSGEYSDEYHLIHDVFSDYDKTVRPRYNSSESVKVNVRFSLQQIYDLDEKRQILTISGWLTAEWRDDFLTWEPHQYGGVKSFVISPLKMWTPLLAIGNSANKMFQDWRYFSVTVRHDGSCRWQPGGNFALTCRLDMNYYPFDSQQCTMEVETWFFSSDKVELVESQDKFGLETYLKHGEWAIDNTEVTKVRKVYSDMTDEGYPEVNFTLYLRRKYTFHFMYILLPCIMLSFVLLMIFLLPAQSGEKVSLGVSILVAFCVFLLIVADQVPDTSDAVPVMAIYLMYFMMATALSVISSAVVIKIHYNDSEMTPPHWLDVLTFDLIAPLLCLNSVASWAKYHRTCNHNKRSCYYINTDVRKMSNTNGLTPSNSSIMGNNVHKVASTLSIDLSDNIQSDIQEDIMNITDKKKYLGQSSSYCFLTKSQYLTEKWKKISEVIDRLFFWLFLLFLIIPLVSLIGFLCIFKGN